MRHIEDRATPGGLWPI